MPVIDFKKPEDLDKAIEKGPWVVEFTANWCGDCQLIEPFLKRLNRDFKGKLKCGRIDLSNKRPRLSDKNGGKAQNKKLDFWPYYRRKYCIKRTPTFIFFKDGEIFAVLVEPDNLKYYMMLNTLGLFLLAKARVFRI